MSKEYKLSTSLYGHSLDVRALAVTPNNEIVSGSRDKTAKLWRSTGVNIHFQDIVTYRDQKNFVGSVLYLEPSEEFPDGCIVTGGNDSIILIYKCSEPFATYTIKEHSNAVSCLSKGKEPNSFLSGSWDKTVKYWSLKNINKSLVTFTGHEAAVWSVIQLCDSRVVSASADKTIGIWNPNGQKLNSLTGHTDCVRGLADFPELNCFVSVANDASIKVWNYSGENINTYYGHTNYIYSIARKKDDPNCFVTSDEDRSVRVWENGVNTQTFHLPAQSVWAVQFLPNGDIVTGSSDGLVRIFTQEESRYADGENLKKFTEEVDALVKQSLQEIGGYKVADLPGKEALFEPGRKAGQMKMIREGTGVVAYTWVQDDENSHWEKVGDVLGGTDKDSTGKTMFEGKAYDFVFSVDVEDGKPPLKLPYNKGDDPYVVANAFLEKNFLPSTYLEQVVDFILKNSQEQYVPPTSEYVDPFTGGTRYTPGSGNSNQGQGGVNLDPFTGGSSYSTGLGPNPYITNRATNATAGVNLDPFTGGSSYSTSKSNPPASMSHHSYFPQTSYRMFEAGDPNVILNKLKEFNKRPNNNFSVDEESLTQLINICVGPPSDANSFELLFKLLDWPDDIIFPVLDVIRMAVKYETNNEIIASMNNGVLLDKLKSYINANCKTETNIIVSLRTLCNLCAHEQGECLIFKNRFDILENVTSFGQLNKNSQVALATTLLNITILIVRRNDDIGFSVLADVIPDIITKLTDAEAHFRAYIALGTLLMSTGAQAKELKITVNTNSNFMSTLELHVLSSQNELETKRMNCVKQLQNVL